MALSKEGNVAMNMEIDPKAIEALTNHQRQLDEDGVDVGISREALDHVLEKIPVLITALEQARAALAEREREIETVKDITREATLIFVPAAQDFLESVASLGEIKDGKTLFELSPTKDADCFIAWQRLNDTGRKLREVLDILKKLKPKEELQP